MKLPRLLACASSALLAMAAATSTAATAGAALKAGTFQPPAPAPELSLQASTGGTLSLAQYRGRVVLLEFGFTNCPKVCPTTLAVLAQVRKRLGADARDLQVVFVTVDPERDSAAQLRAYLHGFDPSFVGGTGTPAQLAAVRQHYGVIAQRRNVGDGYTVGHSSSVFLIDRKGLLRAMMPYGHPPADYLHDIRALLAE
jgi:protein SCO1/2